MTHKGFRKNYTLDVYYTALSVVVIHIIIRAIQIYTGSISIHTSVNWINQKPPVLYELFLLIYMLAACIAQVIRIIKNKPINLPLGVRVVTKEKDYPFTEFVMAWIVLILSAGLFINDLILSFFNLN